MRKLVTIFVFLAITGLTACGGSPTDLAADDCEGVVDPNSYCQGG